MNYNEIRKGLINAGFNSSLIFKMTDTELEESYNKIEWGEVCHYLKGLAIKYGF